MRVDAATDYQVREWRERERLSASLRSKQFVQLADEVLKRRELEDERRQAEERRGERRRSR